MSIDFIDIGHQAPCPQNTPQPSEAPHQLPQPSVRSCNPSDDNHGVVINVSDSESWYANELSELLLDSEALDGSEADGDRTVTCKQHDTAGRSTSVHTCVPRARSRSPRRQVGEPHAAANPHAESHPGLQVAPAESDGKDGKD